MSAVEGWFLDSWIVASLALLRIVGSLALLWDRN